MLTITEQETVRMALATQLLARGVNSDQFAQDLKSLKCKTTWPAERAILKAAHFYKIPLPNGKTNPLATLEARQKEKATAVWRPVRKDYRRPRKGQSKRTLIHVYDSSKYDLEQVLGAQISYRTFCGQTLLAELNE
jgi:hypothetical protein